MTRYALAIGADTAQGRPGDALEYTTGAGGAAFLFGASEESLAVLEGSFSYVTDTPDFFRRPYQHYPQHAGRFTGEPAYFEHSLAAAEHLLADLGRTAQDYAFAVFHQPNTKFPQRAAEMLGFTPAQYETGLLAPIIGNTYAGASLVGMAAVLDVARPGDKVFMVSFGSGAGADAFSFVVTEQIEARRHLAPATQDYIARRKVIDYSMYVRYRQKLEMN
jgi:hydroxymethylglutaryl-CoA synthase